MDFPYFHLDRWLALYEFASPPIKYNLAASTGPVWTFGELLALGGSEAKKALERVNLSYLPPQGGPSLRQRIADLYSVDPDWVVVTTGASEALSMLFALVGEAGASIVLPFPAFPAFSAVANAWGLKVNTYKLERGSGFSQTSDRVLSAVDEGTRLVLINTPHNPTGSVMSHDEIARLAAALAERNIPLLVDEVNHPLYFGSPGPSAASVANTIVVGDMSKALSLSGLRVGWLIDRDAARRERLIDVRSYFTISGSPITEALAEHALNHSRTILSRLEAVAGTNLRMCDDFMNAHRAILGWIRPVGGAIGFPWWLDGRDATQMCEAFARRGVLTVPGACFDCPEHFRLGFGAQVVGFKEALEIMSGVIDENGAKR